MSCSHLRTHSSGDRNASPKDIKKYFTIEKKTWDKALYPVRCDEFPPIILTEPPDPLDPLPTAMRIAPPAPDLLESPEKMLTVPELLNRLSADLSTTLPLMDVLEEPDEMYYD